MQTNIADAEQFLEELEALSLEVHGSDTKTRTMLDYDINSIKEGLAQQKYTFQTFASHTTNSWKDEIDALKRHIKEFNSYEALKTDGVTPKQLIELQKPSGKAYEEWTSLYNEAGRLKKEYLQAEEASKKAEQNYNTINNKYQEIIKGVAMGTIPLKE